MLGIFLLKTFVLPVQTLINEVSLLENEDFCASCSGKLIDEVALPENNRAYRMPPNARSLHLIFAQSKTGRHGVGV